MMAALAARGKTREKKPSLNIRLSQALPAVV
jgi:hypothetical protein